MRVDISFDDGHISDLKAGHLLTKYGLAGTFYYPSQEQPRTIQMTLGEAKRLADQGHEFGGHTVTHPMDLKIVPDDELEFEIYNNKCLIEKCISKKPITKFCYPRGRHDQRVRDMVKKAGYQEARTTLVLKTDLPTDPYQTNTTVHMFPREEYEDVHWFEVAKKYLAIAVKEDSFFSLWGHTAELDRLGYWAEFEELLAIIKQTLILQK